MVKVTVTGATGFIGGNLVGHLLALGYQVYCPVRNPAKFTLRHKNLTIFEDDLLFPRHLAEPIAMSTTVFHLAGTIQGIREDDYFRGNLAATEQLLEIIAVHAPPSQRLVYLSSQAAAGPCATLPAINETQIGIGPVSAYGRSKLAAEELIRKERPRTSVILRPSIVYGPGDRQMLQLFQYGRRGLIPVAGLRTFPVNTIYIKDLLTAIMLAAEKEAALGNTYFVHDGTAHEWREICRMAATAVAARVILLPIFMPIIRFFCNTCGLYGRMTGRTTFLNPDKWKEIAQQGWLCDGSAICRDLKFAPRWKPAEALKETVQWYCDNGWL